MPIHLAAIGAHYETIRLLIEKGAKIDGKNSEFVIYKME